MQPEIAVMKQRDCVRPFQKVDNKQTKKTEQDNHAQKGENKPKEEK